MATKAKDPAAKPAKKRVNSKSKGNAAENKIVKALNVALAPMTFIRSPGSGARVGGQNFDKFGAMFGADAMKLFVADVVPTNERDAGYNFLWSIESKSYKTIDNFNHLVSGTSKIFGWFEESVVDSAKVGKKPMLIFKWNNTPTYLAVEKDDGLPWAPRLTIQNIDHGKQLAIYLFDDMLKEPKFWMEST